MLADFGRLLGRLYVSTGRTWWRVAPALLGTLLLGWLGYYGSVLLSWRVLHLSVWLIVPCLSAGVLVQLAAIVVAMRVAGADRSSRTLIVLANSVLPFLCLMTAFGFVDGFAHDMFMLTAGQSVATLIDSITSLDPTSSLALALIVVGAIVVLYLVRHWLVFFAHRKGASWPLLASAFVESCFGFLVLLTGFRLVQWFYQWWRMRQAFGWWRDGVDWLTGVIHVNLPDVIGRVVSDTWPALWNLLAQPLAWLGLTCLVAGLKLTSSAELVSALRGGKVTHDDSMAAAEEGKHGALTLLRESLADDFDDKVMPAVFAVRYVWRAGPAFLGAFVIAFTSIGLLNEALSRLVSWLFRRQSSNFWLQALPFTGLIDKVISLGLQVALLVVAFNMASKIATERTERAPARVTPSRTIGAVAITIAVIAVVLAGDLTKNSPVVSTYRGAPGAPVAVLGMTVTADDLRLGTALEDPAVTTSKTNDRFVVVKVSIVCHSDCAQLRPQLESNGHTYTTWNDGTSNLNSPLGFRITGDVVFEVLTADLSDDVVITFTPSQTVTTIPQVASFTFPLPSGAVAAAQDVTVNAATAMTTEVAS